MKNTSIVIAKAVALIVGALLLAACATPVQLPPPSAKPSPVDSLIVEPSLAEEDFPEALELSTDGLGEGLYFSFPMADITEVVEKILGEPTHSSEGSLCGPNVADRDGYYSEHAFWEVYDALTVLFTTPGDAEDIPETMVGWQFDLAEPLPENVTIAGDLPLKTSFKQLKKLYPDGKYYESPDQAGVEVFNVSDELFYYGRNGIPEVLQAGYDGWCGKHTVYGW